MPGGLNSIDQETILETAAQTWRIILEENVWVEDSGRR